MKQITKFLCLIVLMTFSINLSAQWNLTGNSGTTAANFIGTTDARSLAFRVDNKVYLKLLPGVNGNPGALVYNPDIHADATLSAMGPGLTINGTINFFNPTNTAWNTQIRFYGQNGFRHNIVDDGGLTFYTGMGNGAIQKTRFTGTVVVGDINVALPTGYSLYVSDGILTEKLKIALKNTQEWSDYVFAPNYKLNTLQEVDTFIQQNQHLPDMPSACEMVENGLDVAKMDAALLRKIEELTLYTIELNNKMKALETKLDEALKN